MLPGQFPEGTSQFLTQHNLEAQSKHGQSISSKGRSSQSCWGGSPGRDGWDTAHCPLAWAHWGSSWGLSNRSSPDPSELHQTLTPWCPLLMSPCHPQHLPQGHGPCLSEATRSHRALGAAPELILGSWLHIPTTVPSQDRHCHCPELPQDPRLAGGGSRGLPTAAGFCSHHECSVGRAMLLPTVLEIRNSGVTPVSPVSAGAAKK